MTDFIFYLYAIFAGISVFATLLAIPVLAAVESKRKINKKFFKSLMIHLLMYLLMYIASLYIVRYSNMLAQLVFRQHILNHYVRTLSALVSYLILLIPVCFIFRKRPLWQLIYYEYASFAITVISASFLYLMI